MTMYFRLYIRLYISSLRDSLWVVYYYEWEDYMVGPSERLDIPQETYVRRGGRD